MTKPRSHRFRAFRAAITSTMTCLMVSLPAAGEMPSEPRVDSPRERISINEGWRFFKYPSPAETDSLIYDVRPSADAFQDDRPADAPPTEATEVELSQEVLKPWILPTGNPFIKDPANRHVRPEGNPGSDFPFVGAAFDDTSWESVTLPHDWAIRGPFLQVDQAEEGWLKGVGGSMGRLPSPGVAWYRKALDIPASDRGRSVFLDVDGAMSYAIVWLNGNLVGGWPYGYASWRLDLTPYLEPGGQNQLAIRLDNPPSSSRWYPGGGIYRNVWLTKTAPVHVGQWGTYVTTRNVSSSSATVDLEVTIDNHSGTLATIDVATRIYPLDTAGQKAPEPVAKIETRQVTLKPGASSTTTGSATIAEPKLWGPPPTQTPHRYLAVTTLQQDGRTIDHYETAFGIRDLRFDPDNGLFVNGERIFIKGVNQHHDLGALGAAFNLRAAERQLELLREMGTNAIRMAHNPPAPELLELTDRMGFLVVDEIYDAWERKKQPLDFHLIFPDWQEPDLRAFIRRDRNHPSVIIWSFGNEVGEQYTGEKGAAIGHRLHAMIKEEDPTRPTTASMNFAKPHMPFPATMDLITLNYQGEGIRNAPAYADLKGITTPPLYPAFHEAFPRKVIVSSENAAALSSRGEYLFPVHDGVSAPVRDGLGGDPNTRHVSAYELYTAPFGSSADKVFASLDTHPYVAGGFVWSGWDYLGEPTPYYLSRSSYFGAIDLAGFPKDRFFLYQARWRPDLPMVHILPHWNWPERVGEVTPVHVFTSGDEAELFLNGESLGRQKKAPLEYRLRWDDVVYAPGELHAIVYREGERWAEKRIETTGPPEKLALSSDREEIFADGKDLAFITVRVTDLHGLTVPHAKDTLWFEIEGPGEIVATDNGDPTDLVPFPSSERNAFNGLALVIVRAIPGESGTIKVRARSAGLEEATISLRTVPQEEPAGAHDNAVAEHAAFPPWNETGWIAHRELLEKARSGQIDVYFLGDSITRRWGALDYPEFLAHWRENFHGWNAGNFGWGGDSTHHMLWRLRNGQLAGVHPAVIVLLAGTNNIGTNPAPDAATDVAEGIAALIEECRKEAPDATIILMAVFPRNDTPEANRAVAEANRLIVRLADHQNVHFLDINDQLADENGRLLAGVTVDGLHLSLEGYDIWARNLKPLLRELLGPPASRDLAPPPTGDPSTRTD